MDREKLKDLYIKYGLDANDVYKHKHYTIITRQGIEKIQAKEDIRVVFENRKADYDFWVEKAIAKKGEDGAVIETLGSAMLCQLNPQTGKRDMRTGNCTTTYLPEMAEKRALSRAVLKLTGFYELGVFGEDEAEDFKRPSVDVKKMVKNN